MLSKIKKFTLSHPITVWPIVTAIVMSIHAKLFSIWGDEIFSIDIAKLSWRDLTILTINDVHPPLYYYLLKLWIGAFGDSEFMLRMLSLIFYLLAVVVILKIVKRLFTDLKIVSLIAIILTFSGYVLRIGIEIRMYALAFLLISLSFLAYLSLERKRIYQALLPILICLAVLTHYVTVLFFVGLLLYDFTVKYAQHLPVKDFLKKGRKLYQSILISTLLYIPWIYLFMKFRDGTIPVSWVPVIYPIEIIYQPILLISGLRLPKYLIILLFIISIFVFPFVYKRLRGVLNLLKKKNFFFLTTFVGISCISYLTNFIALGRFTTFYSRYLSLITLFWFLLSLAEIYNLLRRYRVLKYLLFTLLILGQVYAFWYQNGWHNRRTAKCLENKNPGAIYLFQYTWNYILMDYYLGPNRAYLLTRDDNVLLNHDVWIEAKLKNNNFHYVSKDKLAEFTKNNKNKTIIGNKNTDTKSCGIGQIPK